MATVFDTSSTFETACVFAVIGGIAILGQDYGSLGLTYSISGLTYSISGLTDRIFTPTKKDEVKGSVSTDIESRRSRTL
jgi:hypothetical protein